MATLSDRDVQELYELRDVLERFSVRAGIPVARDSDLAGLRATLDQMREATRAGDRMAVAESHREFHVALVALAGNRQLSAVYGSILVKLQLYMAINLRREAELAQPLDGVHRHERLFEAVAGGDPEEVLAVLAGHGARSYLGELRSAWAGGLRPALSCRRYMPRGFLKQNGRQSTVCQSQRGPLRSFGRRTARAA